MKYSKIQKDELIKKLLKEGHSIKNAEYIIKTSEDMITDLEKGKILYERKFKYRN